MGRQEAKAQEGTRVIKKGVVKVFDPADHTASVQMAGSLSVWLEGVRVARNIEAGEMVIGRRCIVIFFDEANPQDAVITAVYS